MGHTLIIWFECVCSCFTISLFNCSRVQYGTIVTVGSFKVPGIQLSVNSNSNSIADNQTNPYHNSVFSNPADVEGCLPTLLPVFEHREHEITSELAITELTCVEFKTSS